MALHATLYAMLSLFGMSPVCATLTGDGPNTCKLPRLRAKTTREGTNEVGVWSVKSRVRSKRLVQATLQPTGGLSNGSRQAHESGDAMPTQGRDHNHDNIG